MKIGEFLEIYDENCELELRDYETGDYIAEYNGKDSIPKGLNVCQIKLIRASCSAWKVVLEI